VKLFEHPILAIETSCDETSVATVVGRTVRSSIVSSQAELHHKWGGIVPEVAARAHVEAVLPAIEEALLKASLSGDDIGAVAVCNRPGLVGALSVGVSAAKAFAYIHRLPLIGIHHLEGHILSVLTRPDEIRFPHLCLTVSGGHTELVRVDAPMRYTVVGQTLDDAAGEAFDKGSRLLGLGYPGGKAIEDIAVNGNPKRYPLPRGLSGDTRDFSFSGLKTAILRLVEREGDKLSVPDAAASIQEAITSVLADRAIKAAESLGAQALTLTGGVAANRLLRSRLSSLCDRAGIPFYSPDSHFCTDNAAMIGIVAAIRLALGERDDWSLETLPNAPLP
jgi:N6-L-threonylcarbamoyladenine synthase